jgi:SAM-dependent methyltransferase
MIARPVSAAELERLERERAEADRAYNDSLTAVDRAIPAAPRWPSPAAAAGPDQAAALNELWKVVPPQPAGQGIRTRLARFVWRRLAPWFDRQQAFNSALVQYVNLALVREREHASSTAALLDAVRDYSGAIARFHSHLIQYLQSVTRYVDTKDREALGGLMHVYDQAINAIADELLKRAESMAAREQRFTARVQALEDMRGTVASVQQATFTLKRELERSVARSTAAVSAAGETGAPSALPATAASGAVELDSWKYVGFEDRFRGARDEIRRRLADYVPDFAGASDVLDVGCGRGEFLDLLRTEGVAARGLDVNHEMVEICLERGLSAAEGDALGYLQAQPDGSLGGLFAAQVVEHLEPAYLMRTLEVAYHKLRPGSRVVLETINPACWLAFFESYIRDLTHVRPIHPETLQYLLTASGFQHVEIRYRSPVAEHDKLQMLRAPEDAPLELRAAADTLNANVDRLNRLLFTHFDYAAVGVRL